MVIVPPRNAELLRNAGIRLVETVFVARIDPEDRAVLVVLPCSLCKLECELRLACSARPEYRYCGGGVFGAEELCL